MTNVSDNGLLLRYSGMQRLEVRCSGWLAEIIATANLKQKPCIRGGKDKDIAITQQTRDIEPLLVQCWASVVDGGPALNQQWLNVSCLLGMPSGESDLAG